MDMLAEVASSNTPMPSPISFLSSSNNPLHQNDPYAEQQQFVEFSTLSKIDNGIPTTTTTMLPAMATTIATRFLAASAAIASTAATFADGQLAQHQEQQQQHEMEQQQPPVQPVVLDTWRVPPSLFIVFVVFYAAVFFCGLVGNVFVVAAIAMNKSLRTATDWLISSLALADLLILIFCLPSTLLNNLLTEWQLGSFGCKLSVWVNSTTSCASIFTLVGVTGDRYLAICHPLKQLKMQSNSPPLLHLYILGIWTLSGLLASPNLFLYRDILYDLLTGSETSEEQLGGAHRLVAHLCVDTSENIWLFIVINLLIAFLVPIIIICVLYALIFRAVSRHTRKKLAVDNGARVRDERLKLRIAQMMFTVIVVFVLCWTPLYGLYCYFFMAHDRESPFFQFASTVLRPIFQWLSLLSSSLNPLIYIAFSQKYRRAFQHLLLLPCRKRYHKFQRATRNTFRLSCSAFSEKPSSVQLLSSHHANGHLPLCNGASTSSILHHKLARGSLDATLSNSLCPRKVSFCNYQPPSSAAMPTALQQRRKMSEQVTANNRAHSAAILRQQLQQRVRDETKQEMMCRSGRDAQQMKKRQKSAKKTASNSSSASSNGSIENGGGERTPMVLQRLMMMERRRPDEEINDDDDGTAGSKENVEFNGMEMAGKEGGEQRNGEEEANRNNNNNKNNNDEEEEKLEEECHQKGEEKCHQNNKNSTMPSPMKNAGDSVAGIIEQLLVAAVDDETIAKVAREQPMERRDVGTHQLDTMLFTF